PNGPLDSDLQGASGEPCGSSSPGGPTTPKLGIRDFPIPRANALGRPDAGPTQSQGPALLIGQQSWQKTQAPCGRCPSWAWPWRMCHLDNPTSGTPHHPSSDPSAT
ncbi:hypothetical protein P7K49_030367, partial [Saguinus oedipus]